MKLKLAAAAFIIASSASLTAAGNDFTAGLGSLPARAAAAAARDSSVITPARETYALVSGRVTVTCLAPVIDGVSDVTVDLRGWGTFKNNSGDIASRRTEVRCRTTLRLIPGIPVNERVKVSAFAEFYRDGKLIGGTVVSNYIRVTGSESQGLLSLTGSGWLNGMLELKEEAPQAE